LPDLYAVFVTVPAGAMSPKDIRELNKELEGQAYIVATGRSSHMWDAEMCVASQDLHSVFNF
jgi:hypothetical protein